MINIRKMTQDKRTILKHEIIARLREIEKEKKKKNNMFYNNYNNYNNKHLALHTFY